MKLTSNVIQLRGANRGLSLFKFKFSTTAAADTAATTAATATAAPTSASARRLAVGLAPRGTAPPAGSGGRQLFAPLVGQPPGLGELAAQAAGSSAAPRILIGGLGMGCTLRAAHSHRCPPELRGAGAAAADDKDARRRSRRVR